MPARSRLHALLFGALGAGIFLGFSGCDLDWNVRLDPATPVDGTSPEGSAIDSGPNIQEGGIDDQTTPIPDASPDAIACTSIRTEVEDKKNLARACTLGAGGCQLTVKDACNCDVVVEYTGSTASRNFTTAATKLKTSGCDLQCPSPCPTIPAANRICLAKAKDGGTVIECSPP